MTYILAYTLPEFEGCTPKQRFHRNDVWTLTLDGTSKEDIEGQILLRHPGREIVVRFIEPLGPGETRWTPRPGFTDRDNHLHWRLPRQTA